MCNTPNIPMEKLDTQIRTQLADKTFTPNRVRNMLNLPKKDFKGIHTEDKTHIMALEKQLKDTDKELTDSMKVSKKVHWN